MTVFKNTKKELFEIESEFNDLNSNNSNFASINDITTNDIISKQQTENENENENEKVENEILHFIPVIIPLKNVQKSVTLHSKKLDTSNGLSLNVLHAWAAISDTGELKERPAARGQSTDIFRMILWKYVCVYIFSLFLYFFINVNVCLFVLVLFLFIAVIVYGRMWPCVCIIDVSTLLHYCKKIISYIYNDLHCT